MIDENVVNRTLPAGKVKSAKGKDGKTIEEM